MLMLMLVITSIRTCTIARHVSISATRRAKGWIHDWWMNGWMNGWMTDEWMQLDGELNWIEFLLKWPYTYCTVLNREQASGWSHECAWYDTTSCLIRFNWQCDGLSWVELRMELLRSIVSSVHKKESVCNVSILNQSVCIIASDSIP